MAWPDLAAKEASNQKSRNTKLYDTIMLAWSLPLCDIML